MEATRQSGVGEGKVGKESPTQKIANPQTGFGGHGAGLRYGNTAAKGCEVGCKSSRFDRKQTFTYRS